MLWFGKKERELDKDKLPKHVAIIMDGNGRWATKRSLPRSAGHAAGARTFDKIIDAAGNFGIRVVTVYAFSTENWDRPADEVAALMDILSDYLDNGLKKLEGKDTRVKIIGDLSRFSDQMKEKIKRIERDTQDGKSMLVQIALGYGARREITQAARAAAHAAVSGQIAPDDIDEAYLGKLLYNPEAGDVDLLIRPGGEMRISNFLLWQCAYAELYFTDVYWPDFTKEHLREAILWYGSRQRRFGKR